jgi:hypothetical protein
MGTFDLYSKRAKQSRGEVPDVYKYDVIPKPLRVQIVHILRDVLGSREDYMAGDRYDRHHKYPLVIQAYDKMNEILCREYGVFSLIEDSSNDCVVDDIFDFFLAEKDYERVLDVVELGFLLVNVMTRKSDYRQREDASEKADEAIEELNARFKEHGIGYQYSHGKIIRVDSEFLHSEAVKPTLALLAGESYKTANEEFLTAHEHYRHQRYKDCLTWAAKSLESTMKTICEKRKWPYAQTDTAKQLIQTCFNKGLIPDFWQSHFSALRAILESGVPTARNVLAGHGQGAQSVNVPQYLAAYVLHITASTLVFLIEAEKSLG